MTAFGKILQESGELKKEVAHVQAGMWRKKKKKELRDLKKTEIRLNPK